MKNNNMTLNYIVAIAILNDQIYPLENSNVGGGSQRGWWI